VSILKECGGKRTEQGGDRIRMKECDVLLLLLLLMESDEVSE
jgi:hypothetical protein